MQNDELYNQLAFYTLSHNGNDFIHQHLVDAYTIQTANENTKPIAIIYALAGIYLHVVENYTGKEVQEAHLKMSKKSKVFPIITLPDNRGAIKISDIIKIDNPAEKDIAIHKWCETIWQAFSEQHKVIIESTESLL